MLVGAWPELASPEQAAQGWASQVPESQAQAVLESEQVQEPVAQAGQEFLAEKAARVEQESQARAQGSLSEPADRAQE